MLICYVEIFHRVFRLRPTLFPLFLKPLTLIIEKNKNNWLCIKVLKLFDVLMELEPRLIKKMHDFMSKMLTITIAKSIEFELISLAIHHYREFEGFFGQAKECLKNFINHTDANRNNKIYLQLLSNTIICVHI